MLKREPYIDLVIGPQAYHKINDTILNHKEKKKKLDYWTTAYWTKVLISDY